MSVGRFSRPLARSFFDRPTLQVAEDLIGRPLVHRVGSSRMVGRIVETEAYDGFDDKASHASRRKTPRNSVMFGPPGYAYVYLIYGMHHCLNFVTREEGYPAAVLIRALEPVEGVELSTKGPGRLCKALEITRAHDGLDITASPLYVAATGKIGKEVLVGPRIGVDYAGEWANAPRRFYAADNPWVSR